MPTKGSEFAAGYDLYATEKVRIPAFNYGLVGTGIAMAIPFGFYGRIAGRSGLSSKTGLMVNAGVIDSDYRGEIKVLFNNPTDQDVEIQVGDKMAQIIITLIGDMDLEELGADEKLPESDRGEYGFGSTGAC
jgi:dUTP pyrophosphatase